MSRCSLCTGQEGERSAARSPAAIRPRRPARHEPRKGKAALWPASACDRKGQREKKNGPIAARLFFACHSGKNKKYRKKIHVIRRRIGRAAQRARATFSPFFFPLTRMPTRNLRLIPPQTCRPLARAFVGPLCTFVSTRLFSGWKCGRDDGKTHIATNATPRARDRRDN